MAADLSPARSRRQGAILRKRIIAAALAASLAGPVSAGGIPVFDASNVAEAIKQIVELRRQYDMLRMQYESITGSRGFGSILYNPALARHLPPDVRRLYEAARRGANGGFYSITGAAQEVLNAEVFRGSVQEMGEHIAERQRQAVATDKAAAIHAYQAAQQRIGQIEGLMAQVDQTQDAKAIAELQGRIAAEQAMLANGQQQIALLAQLSAAEQRLIDEQRADMTRRVFSAQNTGMPTLGATYR